MARLRSDDVPSQFRTSKGQASSTGNDVREPPGPISRGLATCGGAEGGGPSASAVVESGWRNKPRDLPVTGPRFDNAPGIAAHHAPDAAGPRHCGRVPETAIFRTPHMSTVVPHSPRGWPAKCRVTSQKRGAATEVNMRVISNWSDACWWRTAAGSDC
jgi:hypothetical protein